jgi:hypothetical protein
MSQMGVSPAQSLSDAHAATQAPETSHFGVAGSIAWHWASALHATQS